MPEFTLDCRWGHCTREGKPAVFLRALPFQRLLFLVEGKEVEYQLTGARWASGVWSSEDLVNLPAPTTGSLEERLSVLEREVQSLRTWRENLRFPGVYYK